MAIGGQPLVPFAHRCDPDSPLFLPRHDHTLTQSGGIRRQPRKDVFMPAVDHALRSLARLGVGLAFALCVCAPIAALAQGGPSAVIVAEATVDRIADRLEALGTLNARERVVITPAVSDRIAAIHFDDGHEVAAGTVLAELEQAEERAALAAARADVAEQQAAFDRADALARRQITATATLEERRAALDRARADVAVAEARLADRTITAPFAGVLGLREISPGALVGPGDPIAVLSDLSTLKLDLTVPSSALADLRVGVPIRARSPALPDRSFDGVVTAIDTAIDPETRAMRVRATLPNRDGALRPGLLMSVTVLVRPREALLVPEEALIGHEAGHAVFVVGEGSDGLVAERRRVRIGDRQPGRVEILEGLRAGERVVIHGVNRVRDGAAVTVRAVDDGTASLSDLLAPRDPADPAPRPPPAES